MKFFTFAGLLFGFLAKANTQDIFDYENFLTTFNIKFDQDRFVSTFFANNQLNPTEAQPAFNLEEFVKTFFTQKKKNLASEPDTSNNVESQPEENFDIEDFKRVFNLECVGQCQKDFDMEKFLEAFNLRKKDEKFDYDKFLETFNLRISDEEFDWERFANTFSIKKDSPYFDYQHFRNTFFEGQKKTRNGGALQINDGLSGAV